MWIYYVFFPNWILKAFIRAVLFVVFLIPKLSPTSSYLGLFGFWGLLWMVWTGAKEVFYNSIIESSDRFLS